MRATRVYVATRLERAAEARAVLDLFRSVGWEASYDWTTHGAVFGCGLDGVAAVAEAESVGVTTADLVVVLLPGGRGTHVELGMAIASSRRVILVGKPEHFDCGTDLCAFYVHPRVERWTGSVEDLVARVSESPSAHAREKATGPRGTRAP